MALWRATSFIVSISPDMVSLYVLIVLIELVHLHPQVIAPVTGSCSIGASFRRPPRSRATAQRSRPSSTVGILLIVFVCRLANLQLRRGAPFPASPQLEMPSICAANYNLINMHPLVAAGARVFANIRDCVDDCS